MPDSIEYEEKLTSGGFLDARTACNLAVADRPAIRLIAGGSRRAGAACYFLSSRDITRLALPEDTYTVNAFEPAFALAANRLERNSKFEVRLLQQGPRVSIRLGQTARPELCVLTTRELLNLALGALKNNHGRTTAPFH